MHHPTDLGEYSWPVCVTPRCNRQLWVTEATRWACRPCEDSTAERIAELPSLFRQLDTTAMLMRGARRSRPDCTTMALDRRNLPSIPGWGGREAKTLGRLGSGSWYDLATGLQDDSGATRIERVA
ncbi:hypothetical protein ACWD25_31090 [Streptomyces sp. NPDC002920]